MEQRVRLRSGVEITLSSGDTVSLDGPGPTGPSVVSHAHTDHLVSDNPLIASGLTARLAEARAGRTHSTATDPRIELVNAGHVAGSRAAYVTEPDDGTRYLYTGDISTRDRWFLSGFQPEPADVLVIETTYGTPAYRFPPTSAVAGVATDWLEATMDSIAVLFGYALGRAQSLQCLAQDAPRSRILTTESIRQLNDIIETHRGVEFETHGDPRRTDLGPGDVVIAPASAARTQWGEALLERPDVATAAFTGWAAQPGYAKRRGVDEAFVLSDHCDFDELTAVVKAVDPERVYTVHGFTDAFARHLTSEHGYPAQSLRPNQSSLTEFTA